MGLKKVYITKQSILSHLENSTTLKQFERAVTIEKLFHSDIRIMDTWSNNFFMNLNREERLMRNEMTTFIHQDKVDKFNSLTETLISLYFNPSLLDCIVTQKLLSLSLNKDDLISLNTPEQMYELCKIKIIEHFDKNTI
jgi:hypothetical protein